MLPVDTYERRASECLQFAETSQSFDDRATWRELALCWLRLSDHAERFRAGAFPDRFAAGGGTQTPVNGATGEG
jgi:hypothetical protein